MHLSWEIVLVLLAIAVPGMNTARAQLSVSENLPKRSAEEWRRLYPFKSVEERLAYEANRAEEKPALSAEAQKRLAEQDQINNHPWGNLRLSSLKKLHSAEVEEFIKRDGNGLERFPRASVRTLHLPPAPSLPFGQVSYEESMLKSEGAVTLPNTGGASEGPGRLPSLPTLLILHDTGRQSFVDPDSFGLVADRKNVAGFEPHQFRYPPRAQDLQVMNPPDKKGNERWVLRRLELVSLLKFEKPAVYISNNLPRMEDLKNAPRRALNSFEATALQVLQKGEDLATEATTNRIRMMGALRAGKKCLECHRGERGALLGTFSYEMLRDPMVIVQ